MKKEKSCGAVIFTKNDDEIKYLIIKQHQGFHGFPKGHVEKGESEEETALREIQEEVGLEVELIPDFREKMEYKNPENKNAIKEVIFFLAKADHAKMKIQEEEILEVNLLNYNEAMKQLTHENSKDLLEKARKFIEKNVNKNLYLRS